MAKKKKDNTNSQAIKQGSVNQRSGNQGSAKRGPAKRGSGQRGSAKQGPTKQGSARAGSGGNSEVSIVFLGGLGEIGRNCAAIEQDGSILLIDCGLMFPDSDMLGVDLVLPDFTWLLERADSIVGLVATHGHEDHVGGLSYLLRDASFPLYGTQLTLGLAKGRIEEARLLGQTSFNVVRDGEKVQVGPFELEFLPVTHSVPDGVATVIRTAQGNILHTGDLKIDLTPVDGRLTDLTRMGAIADSEGIRLLLADSTNAEEAGHSASETTVGAVLYNLMHQHEGRRVITACFASHIHRIQQISDAAISFGRKVAPLGRSMRRNVSMAREMGLLRIPDTSIIDIEEVDNYPPGEVCVICTGSQGEPRSALTLLASSENRWLKLTPHDTVILSSHPIPGNEQEVSRVIGNLIKQGAEVVHSGISDVHATGHAKAEELKLLQSILQPEWFVPVHGEYRHMAAHARLAETMGRPHDRILLAEDGDRLTLDSSGLQFSGRVPSEYIYVHGTIGDIGSDVLASRRILAEEGVVSVIVCVDTASGTLVAGPEIATRGWVDVDESAELLAEMARKVRKATEDALADGQPLKKVERAVRRSAGGFVSERTRRRPMIVPVVFEP
jgi:ribonuclease J